VDFVRALWRLKWFRFLMRFLAQHTDNYGDDADANQQCSCSHSRGQHRGLEVPLVALLVWLQLRSVLVHSGFLQDAQIGDEGIRATKRNIGLDE